MVSVTAFCISGIRSTWPWQDWQPTPLATWMLWLK